MTFKELKILFLQKKSLSVCKLPCQENQNCMCVCNMHPIVVLVVDITVYEISH